MSRKACVELLANKDRSAVILSKYIPNNCLDGWIALRALNIETSRVVDGAKEPAVALARMQYWKTAIQQAYSSPGEHTFSKSEPTARLLSQALQEGANIPKRYLLTLVQTKEHQIQQPPLRSVEDLGRLGEGTASQMLYATFDLLQTLEPGTLEYLQSNPQLDELTTNILAHLGQAQGIASAIRGLEFHANKQNRLLIPSEVLSAHNVIEQEVLNSLSSGSSRPETNQKLKNATFEVATAANDHILAARMLLKQFKEHTMGKAPRSLLLTTMGSLPTVLYLERLQKYDFDVFKQFTEWRLPWRTWRAYRTKSF